MNILPVRRLAQAFFFLLFLWFCIVTTVGDRWWQLRGWPVNWFLQLDPLVALGTVLATKTLYAGLAWGLVTIALTLILGRFFCGWICPFGALHQFVGWLGRRRRPFAERVAMNQYRPAQVIKYYLLLALLAAAAGGLLSDLLRLTRERTLPVVGVALAGAATWRLTRHAAHRFGPFALKVTLFGAFWLLLGFAFNPASIAAASLQTGWLDPIPLVHRSVNLLMLAVASGADSASRFNAAAWSIAAVFFATLFLNLWIPRFYCRFLCPLGALFGILSRWAPWRIGKRQGECSGCELCENNCEGACDPFGQIRIHECLLCLNCLKACRQAQMTYGPQRSAAGEIAAPGLSRRGFLAAAVGGLAAVPAVRLAGALDQNWDSAVVRPPGALAEKEFLERCIKCGQCMRACPTNVLQPALAEAGWEGVWTPILNFRIGSSGCQLACVACGNVCPTAAIRPLSLDEKLGRGDFAELGPVRIGLAFVDRSRCLPWAMELPCIVCQENCPVSPKAILVREEFEAVHDGARDVLSATTTSVVLSGAPWGAGKLATGDYYVRPRDAAAGDRRRIAEQQAATIHLAAADAWPEALPAGTALQIEVRLQKPMVDPDRCTGCGVCQHECPVSGLRAIRVTAENESRTPRHSLTTRS